MFPFLLEAKRCLKSARLSEETGPNSWIRMKVLIVFALFQDKNESDQ